MPPAAPQRFAVQQRPGRLGPAEAGMPVPGRSTGAMIMQFLFGRVGEPRGQVKAADVLARQGLAGASSPIEAGTMSVLPTRIASWVRPAFWNPRYQYQRREFLASPPLLPGTAIPFTLFHPNYVGGGGAGATSPGLQGYKWTLPWSFGWEWGKHSFREFGTYEMARDHVNVPASYQSTGTRAATVREPNSMRQPIGIGQGLAWFQPAPYYTPGIINPPQGMGAGRTRWRRMAD
jgi:hypothetical protein